MDSGFKVRYVFVEEVPIINDIGLVKEAIETQTISCQVSYIYM